MRLPFLLLSLFGLAACASLVPSTLAQLQALDPLSADPAEIQVALILPPGLAVAPGSAQLTLAVTRQSETLNEAFALVAEPAAVSGVTAPVGATAQIFHLAEADVRRMRDAQAKAAAWETEDPDGTQGSLAVGLGGCGVGAGPSPQARASVLIRTGADRPFLPLIRDAQVRELIGPALFDAIKPCETRQ